MWFERKTDTDNDDNKMIKFAEKSMDRVIRDQESDQAFLQRLKESRDFWDLDEVPLYKNLICATCTLSERPSNRVEMLKELTHDMVNLVAYYHDCEDKDKEYECKYCVDEFNGVVNEELEDYACGAYGCSCEVCNPECDPERAGYLSDEDYTYEDEDKDEDSEEDPDERRERKKQERKKEKAYQKRNQREHMAHLEREHIKKLRVIVYFKQDLIPKCDAGFWDEICFDCVGALDDVLQCMGLNKGHKFLHMEEPPRPVLPSPHQDRGILDDYTYYRYDNEWDSMDYLRSWN